MYNVTIFGMELTLNPIAFTIPIGSGWNVYWYGIIIATGFLLAVIYGLKTAHRFRLNKDRIIDGILIVAPVSVLCARAYYLMFDGVKMDSIGDFFGFTGSQGFSGLAIYGAVIGAAVSGAIVCKLFKLNVLDALDLTSIGFMIGQAIGRWGNFINQEAYGDFTGSDFWGMTSERTVAEMGEGLVHPCFLYESVWCVAGFFILNYFSKRRSFKGQILLMYCTWYGFGRAIIELMRTDSLMIGPFKVSFLLSLLLCIGGAVSLIVISKKKRGSESDIQYTPLFADAAKEQTGEVSSNEENTEHEADTDEITHNAANDTLEDENGADN